MTDSTQKLGRRSTRRGCASAQKHTARPCPQDFARAWGRRFDVTISLIFDKFQNLVMHFRPRRDSCRRGHCIASTYSVITQKYAHTGACGKGFSKNDSFLNQNAVESSPIWSMPPATSHAWRSAVAWCQPAGFKNWGSYATFGRGRRASRNSWRSRD